MSYTNIELIKSHINIDDSIIKIRRNYSLEFVGTDWLELPGRILTADSIIVKTIKNLVPTAEEITISAQPAKLNNSNLVEDSVTVASDSSLGKIYQENEDYFVNYNDGSIAPLEDSEIEINSLVKVWYYFYTPYTENVDYQMNYQDGQIRRLVDGKIQENQTVLIDYGITINQLSDEAISGAVTEANAIIEQQVDPENQFGADLTLQTAATYLAVSFVCRISAANDLKYGQYGRQTTPSWMVLSESYRKDYETLIKAFRSNSSRLNRPTFF